MKQTDNNVKMVSDEMFLNINLQLGIEKGLDMFFWICVHERALGEAIDDLKNN